MKIKRARYYTLIAGLPALPRFDRTDKLPLTRKQLEERLRMLEPRDAKSIKAAESYLFWRGQPKKESDEELVKQYAALLAGDMTEELREFIQLWMSERTVLVALRRKFRGLPAPKQGELWGVGRWVRHIEKNWEDPHFQLASVYSWIVKARELLYAGETVELERLILNYAWDRLTILTWGKEWDVINVTAYLLKWNMIQHWLSFNPAAARTHFEELVTEISNENTNALFA
jgi:hypothetical protein